MSEANTFSQEELKDLPINKLLAILKGMSPGVPRDFLLYRWKHLHNPKAGLFSTAHGADSVGTLFRALEDNNFSWEDEIITNGKKVVLEYERNFNEFVAWVKTQV